MLQFFWPTMLCLNPVNSSISKKCCDRSSASNAVVFGGIFSSRIGCMHHLYQSPPSALVGRVVIDLICINPSRPRIISGQTRCSCSASLGRTNTIDRSGIGLRRKCAQFTLDMRLSQQLTEFPAMQVRGSVHEIEQLYSVRVRQIVQVSVAQNAKSKSEIHSRQMSIQEENRTDV